MIVTDTFRLKGYGVVFITVLDCQCPPIGSRLIRPADGQTWTVKGILRYMHAGPVMIGEQVGVLVSEGPDPQGGDVIERASQVDE